MKTVQQDIKALKTEALVAFFYQDVRPLKGIAGEVDWLLCGSLSSLLQRGKLPGVVGDVALLSSQGKLPAQKIFLMGLGPRSSFSPAVLRRVAEMAADGALRAGVRSLALEGIRRADLPSEETDAALRQGLLAGAGGRELDVVVLAGNGHTMGNTPGSAPVEQPPERRSGN